MPNRPSHRFRTAVLTFSSLAVSLLLFEFALRVLPISVLPKQPAHYWDHWGRTPEEIEEGRRAYNSRHAYDPDVGFIRKELLAAEQTFQRRRGVRIMFLGDSVTDYAMYTAELERNLRQRFSQTEMDFLNAGVGGWNTRNERIYLETHGLKYRPEVVVLQFHLNDFLNTPVVLRQQDGTWLAFDAGRVGDLFSNSLLNSSRLMQFLFFRYLELRNTTNSWPNPNLVETELSRIRDLSRTNGFALRVLLFPVFRRPTEEDTRSAGLIRTICERLGLQPETVDLIERMKDIDLEAHPLSPGDYSHPDAFAAKRAADEATSSVVEAVMIADSNINGAR